MKFKTERILEWELAAREDLVVATEKGGMRIRWTPVGGIMDYAEHALSPEELSEIARNCAMVWLDV